MKYKFIILSSLLMMLVLIYSCASMDSSLFKEKPKAEIEKVDIQSISLQDVTLLFDVKISNPYPVGINLAGISSKFLIEQKQLFETSSAEGLKIPAKKSAMNSFTVNLKYTDIINIIKDYQKKDALNCAIDGNIVLAIPKTGIPGVPPTYTFPYKLEKKIPAIKPSINIKNFTIKKPSSKEIIKAVKDSGKSIDPFKVIKLVDKLLTGKYEEAFKIIKPEDLDLKFDVNFDIVMKNETKSKMVFDKFQYDFFLNSDKLIKGETTDIKMQGNKSILRVQNRISLVTFSKSITQALKKKSGDFHLQGETYLKLPAIKKEPIKLLFNEKGNVKITTK